MLQLLMDIMNYHIRIGSKGYYGKAPFRPVPLEEAVIFPTMKEARRVLNRLNARLMPADTSEIETAANDKTIQTHQ